MSGRNRLYPHLLPQDINVWEQFLAEHGHKYSQFDYDVRVGRGRDPGARHDPNIRRMAVNLSMRRIDAVGHRPGFFDIIEITTVAGIHAIGQMQVYPLLFAQTFKPLKPLRSLLVCRELGTDVTLAIEKLNILLYLYPDEI